MLLPKRLLFSIRKVSPLTVGAPLMVMLLLTIISGVTTYQLADTWRQSARQITHQATQAVVLSNIRNDLEKIREEWPKNPELAHADWQAVRQQAQMLWSAAQSEGSSANTGTLQRVMIITSREENIAKLDTLLKQQRLSINLSQLPHDLEELGNYSSFVTSTITYCMVALGAILTLLTAWDLSRWMEALLRSRDLNIRLQEEERRRIAGELHDGVMQDLIDLKRSYAPEKLDDIVHNLRRLCQNLKPQILVDLGLKAALQALAADLQEAGVANVRLALDVDNLTHLPASSEVTLFRVVQELFANIRKHANAQQVIVTLTYHPQESPWLRGYIQDDGCGFDVHRPKTGSLGLTGVEERIRQLGGSFKIESKPEKGAQVYFQIPINQQPRDKRVLAKTAIAKEGNG